jgi:Xaa-Pro aminopeptidase
VATNLLTREELDQLNAYHARVLEVVGPQLEGAAKEWLIEVCRPL